MKRMFPGLLMICLLSVSAARAEDLRTAIQRILESDSQIKAANADTEAARLRYKAVLGEMFPTVELEGTAGSGDFERDWTQFEELGPDDIDESFAETNTSFSSVSARLVQPLTFFGVQRAEKNRARSAYQRSYLDGVIARQDLVLKALTAYVKLKQAEEDVKYAGMSVDNIKKQTDMESDKVAKGAGLSTDVLQAKVQLLRAEAWLMRAKGQLVNARNSAETVFSMAPDKVSALTKVDLLPADALPKDLANAEMLAGNANQSIRIAELAEDSARDVLSSRRWMNMPRVNGVLEWAHNENISGSDGSFDEQMLKIEVVYAFNLGLSSISSARSARKALTAAEQRVVDARKQVLEEVRNAWQSLSTATETAKILRRQEAVAEEFLELARKERTLGRRSLLDLLNGENTLIEARSAAASAEAEIEVNKYQMLRAVGVLDIEPDKAGKRKK